ncbi:hypothetical protein F441_09065 [Phytophthora nicotianae CJ01A1]|uniref:Uncharacterized protein n=5 Tax=Phytophthora nicotianae TaxID=4792 RepID=V9F5Y8_PHYNI|nr:hypothetical protein F443_09102 [Phytophthora nicotianae P1569]ETK86450.1 hypothetical protein L915_08919 [Phytophthora nicotianae]ETO75216.1 hypothetical protein F444_09155 [Phytophthora nicotianae P1976]ETP16313.1 hypothetical protein F441_09065 [Phytophthora nicotianae CJ01A1]ETP44349.1 hypothetical protein F442_09033 [Phytophthora nicotianae P10297]
MELVLQEMKRMMAAIFLSPLVPWQKINSIKTYVYPKDAYLIHHIHDNKA